MNKKILYIFTRTPLHVGAGSSVGAIDQPVIRERHTGFPIIPASSLKGTFADEWNSELLIEQNNKGESKKVRVKKNGESTDAAWLFGSDNDKNAAAGSLLFSEARLLAFPIRSAKGSFAWITCPLILARAQRDGVLGVKALSNNELAHFSGNDGDEKTLYAKGASLDLSGKIVLEDYTFSHTGDLPTGLGDSFTKLMSDDPVWQEVASRLVILSDGMMSFFVQNACEVAQHVRINDETGTAEGRALFNQENVPSETLFYSVLNATDRRGAAFKDKTADNAHAEFGKKLIKVGSLFQFGGDASTGLGYCTVKTNEEKEV